MSEPVAWAVTIGKPDDLYVYEAYAAHQRDEAVALATECVFGDTSRPLPLAPLYFQPLPTLTDAEREAVERVRRTFRDMDHKDMTMQQMEDYEAICVLLERTRGS